jgi:DNA mismatch repair protein MutS
MNPLNYYREAKERHPGMILMFRVGDFYELFESDAETAARVLGLPLTIRDKVFPMTGFPHHALESHLRKLLHAGHRVAICDQIQPFSTRGAEVNRVVTPGYVPQEDAEEDSAEEKPMTLTYIGKGGNWKQVPWMFD